MVVVAAAAAVVVAAVISFVLWLFSLGERG
jgi:hypothetical protein